jgi:hypothetical protein
MESAVYGEPHVARLINDGFRCSLMNTLCFAARAGILQTRLFPVAAFSLRAIAVSKDTKVSIDYRVETFT